jgi:Domain of unknown function (DUF4440)
VRTLISTIALLVGLAAWPSAQGEGSSADEVALRRLKEVEWPKAYREQDAELLDRILADEFEMIDGDGAWFTKRDELEYVRNNKPTYDSFRFEIKRLDIFDNGVAVIAGTGVIRDRDSAGPFVLEYQSTNVLIKRAGRWQAIASHVSGAQQRREEPAP